MALTDPISRRGLGLCLAAGIAALALPLAAGPAAAATPDEIKARGKLIVGVLTDYPPFGGTDAEQKPAGYDADVAALMAKKLGVSLELVPVTGPNRIPYLLTNKVDLLIATFGITSGQALAGVVGPLIEVPVLVGLVYVSLALRTRLFPADPSVATDLNRAIDATRT